MRIKQVDYIEITDEHAPGLLPAQILRAENGALGNRYKRLPGRQLTPGPILCENPIRRLHRFTQISEFNLRKCDCENPIRRLHRFTQITEFNLRKSV